MRVKYEKLASLNKQVNDRYSLFQHVRLNLYFYLLFKIKFFDAISNIYRLTRRQTEPGRTFDVQNPYHTDCNRNCDRPTFLMTFFL